MSCSCSATVAVAITSFSSAHALAQCQAASKPTFSRYLSRFNQGRATALLCSCEDTSNLSHHLTLTAPGLKRFLGQKLSITGLDIIFI